MDAAELGLAVGVLEIFGVFGVLGVFGLADGFDGVFDFLRFRGDFVNDEFLLPLLLSPFIAGLKMNGHGFLLAEGVRNPSKLVCDKDLLRGPDNSLGGACWSAITMDGPN